MFECPVAHPALPKLFDAHLPNDPALWAVLHGQHAGRALVDNLERPMQCALRTEPYLTFVNTTASFDFIAKSVQAFKQAGVVWLIRSHTDLSLPECDRIYPRLEFYDCDPHSSALEDFRSRTPPGCRIQKIDRTLLERCLWCGDMAFYCGSLENFLQNGLGICLMHDDEILVEAYASAFGAGNAEIGAVTHEPYRGRGYAPIAVAHLIHLLAQRGYQAYWSCDVDNEPSSRVAQKLGFRVKKTYEIWEYAATKD
ncbi:MAG: hypothetical protein C3F13_13045 [Anaerolineales bacterium]|nr:GNAT family N-acetyltransferase [Anaerolineae bacterium]PWB51368.1 MAG: hypothetical protein C3F13_13045 [Anaerolineales bacterium]